MPVIYYSVFVKGLKVSDILIVENLIHDKGLLFNFLVIVLAIKELGGHFPVNLVTPLFH